MPFLANAQQNQGALRRLRSCRCEFNALKKSAWMLGFIGL